MGEGSKGETDPVEKAAAICYRRNAVSIEILLVRAHAGGWIFPKGGIEPGEKAWQAAQREAFEEAGVTGQIQQKRLTTFLHFKQGINKEYRVEAFLLLVGSMQPPQESQRQPGTSSPLSPSQIIRYRQIHPKGTSVGWRGSGGTNKGQRLTGTPAMTCAIRKISRKLSAIRKYAPRITVLQLTRLAKPNY